MTGEDQQSGALQIEFGDKPDAILRKRRGVCSGFAWDPDQECYHPMGVIETFEYAPARLVSPDGDGVIRARTDGMAHGSLVLSSAHKSTSEKVIDGSWKRILRLPVWRNTGRRSDS